MQAEIKKKWVDALRSGKYRQGRGSLRNNLGYCCLGVLCDLQKKSDDNWEKTERSGTFRFNDGSGPTSCYPPPAVVSLYEGSGIDTEGLASLNDGGDSFEKIADFIEQNASIDS